MFTSLPSKVENHEHMIGLYFAFYNFARVHQTLKTGQLIAAAIGALLFLFPGVVAARRRPEAGGPSPTV
jgi:hypothetical protein